ncbi:hypothetical protein KIN20_033320 [Parelaphostrongylus tenuis]|uniref:Uncharacterized protein n=1 Tax=Parelaphostrongylus tenuis TaxID=148309 RepID=A0AAD5WIB0_PARTN|nr:hypothetical protein KIN20_033320 [Parelaphostrongylus tenuis]
MLLFYEYELRRCAQIASENIKRTGFRANVFDSCPKISTTTSKPRLSCLILCVPRGLSQNEGMCFLANLQAQGGCAGNLLAVQHIDRIDGADALHM